MDPVQERKTSSDHERGRGDERRRTRTYREDVYVFNTLLSILLVRIGTNNYFTAKRISLEWKTLPLAEKQVWKDRAKEEARQFKLKYPTYRFQPRKSSAIKRRAKKT